MNTSQPSWWYFDIWTSRRGVRDWTLVRRGQYSASRLYGTVDSTHVTGHTSVVVVDCPAGCLAGDRSVSRDGQQVTVK